MKLFRNGKSFLNYVKNENVYWISWRHEFFGDCYKPATNSDYYKEQL